jgi:anti-sigma B factor antagonist
MDIISTAKEDMLILDFIGQLDTGTAPKVEVEVNKHLESNQKIIFNLAQTIFGSSAGLRIFLGPAKKLKASGGLFRICNANEVVQEILDISGFSQILDVKKSLEEAVVNFN